MSQLAIIATSIGGAVIGGAIGGPIGASIGGSIGMAAGNAFFGPKPQDQYGPRLTDVDVSTASEGEIIPIMWGSMRLAGDIIWAPKLVEVAREEEVGGKGFGGGAEYTTYYALGSWALSFGYNRDGIPRTLRRIWVNKELAYDATEGKGALLKQGFTFTYYDGTQTDPDPTMESYLGIGNVPAYTGQALLVFDSLNLEQFQNHIPSIEAELVDDADTSTSLDELDLSPWITPAHMAGIGWLHYHEETRLLWGSWGAGFFDPRGALVTINPATRSVVRAWTQTYGSNGGNFWFTSYNGYQDRVTYNATSSFTTWDPKTFDLLNPQPKGLASMNAASYPMFRGLVNVTELGAYRYWGGDSNSTHNISYPAAYNAQSYAHATKLTAVTNLGVRTQQADINNTFFVITATQSTLPRHGYFTTTLLADASTPVCTAVVSTYASAALSENISGLSMPNGGFHDNGVYADASDSYFFPFNTVDAEDPSDWMLEIEPETGYVLGCYDMSERLGLGLQFNWNANGHPTLWYDKESKRIWFAGYNHDVCWFDVLAKQGGVYTGQPRNSPVYFHNESGTAIGIDINRGVDQHDHFWFLNAANVAQGQIAVASVIRDVAVRNGVESSDITFANVSTVVTGALANAQTSGRAMINTLLQYAYADGYESDYLLKFVSRGGAVATTLVSDYLGATPGGGNPEPTSLTVPHHIEIPYSLDLRFFNSDKEYQIGDVNYTWQTSLSQRRSTMSLPIADSANNAIKSAARLLHSAYNQSPVEFTYGPRYAALEPTDIVNMPINDRQERVRIDQIRRGVNGVRNAIGAIDRQEDLVTYVSAAATNSRNNTIINNGPVFPLWLDTTLLQDTDADNPGPYVAVYNNASTTQVGFMYTSNDNNTYSLAAQFQDMPQYGRSLNTIPVASAGAFDVTTTLNVQGISGTLDLTTTTSAALDSGANAIAVGRPGRWEIMQFLSAAVASTGYNQLHGLRRGRRGSDYYIDQHELNDFVVVLGTDTIRRINKAVANIGDDIFVRTTRAGESWTEVSYSVFSVTANALRPYSPISVVIASTAGGGLTGAWTRRTRAGGSTVGLYENVGGPIGEDSESYEIDVVNSAGTVVGSAAIATTSANFHFGSARQASVGIIGDGEVTFRIFQMSAAVGRGFPASALFVRS